MKVAVVDSGIHAGHPHVGGIAGGVSIVGGDVVDRVGHGTAVAAAIREKAPDVELYAVKIFDRKLATDVITLVRAIHWCAANGIELVNLSLGTTDSDNGPMLQLAVDEALADGTRIVSAYEYEGVQWLPGSLPGVISVLLDWDIPREECRLDILENGREVYRASGYPRPIPGVPPEENLKGISFAVANVTGCLSSKRKM